jgi:succinoglycan biosynthesis protein ExoO
MSKNDAAPRVSVIMANYNGAAHIAVAVRSALRQTERSLELILSDDGSSDDGLQIACGAAGGDRRLIVLRGSARTGPAGARNRALEAARGRWIAIVDNDDYIHPERLERLIGAAERDGADIVCDDLLTFYEGHERAAHAHLRGAWAEKPHWVGAATYVRSNVLFGGGAMLGYLKPVFRRNALRYDETLTIGEDSDLIARMLGGGARMRVHPELGYFYRKHAGSISHRLNTPAIEAMLAAAERLGGGENPALAHALALHRHALCDARAFVEIVDALKTRDLGPAVSAWLRRPAALLLMREPLIARLFPSKTAKTELTRTPRVTLLSRQRIVGRTNGSSAYVLALAGALKRSGYAVDYLGPSPKTFGRWAAMKLRPELDVFDSYRLRGGIRAGNLMLARDPAIWLASLSAVLARVAGKFGIKATWSKPAEYAQGASATRADMLYVARQTARPTRAILCDYAFVAPLASYALKPDAPAFIIMHDLMSARMADKAEANAVEISADDEFRLLGMSDGVVAIQADEAAKVRVALPGTPVILAPHAVEAAPAPQPGEDDSLLFVGSNTSANVVGLDWFFREIWPAIRAARPGAELRVAGSVARALGAAPDGVKMLGVVNDLAPLYRDAGVVVSPLYTGSGLKIKLIEALAAGKAVVGTSVTVQGVEAATAGALVREDDPARFARAIVGLLGKSSEREALGQAALACTRAHFSAETCFADLVTAVRSGATVATAEKLLQVEIVQSQ